jgi:hypothetical protein
LGITVLSVVALVASGGSPLYAALPAEVSPTSTITMPVRPAGLAIDSSGTTHVAGYGTGAGTEVLILNPAGSSVGTLTGLSAPWDVAINPRNGEILVSNWSANTVSVFTSARVLARTLGVNQPTGLAVTEAGQTLVGSWADKGIYVFEGASTTAARFINTVSEPGGMAVDPSSNLVYVAFPTQNLVARFAVDSGILIPGLLGGFVLPWDVALQAQTGMLFVTNYAGGSGVRVFAVPKDLSAIDMERTLLASPGVQGPWGVAVNPTNGAVHATYQYPVPGRVQIFPSVVSAVSGVNPAVGPVTGGTVVEVSGTNLGAVTSVTFNGVAGEIVGRPEPTRVVVKVPAATTAGTVAVQIAWAGNTAGKTDAFEYKAVAPGPATGLKVTPGNGRVDVTWAAPAFTGGAPVQGYLVTPSPGGAPCSTTERDCTISGLTNGQKYTFTVTTTNTAGLTSVSEPSAEVAPYVPIKQTVKAKKASSKVPRKGYATIVNWVKKPKYAALDVTTSCYVPQGLAGAELTSAQLCKFSVYKTGKVKVRTKGYRNVRVSVTIRSVPKSGAPIQYGPSTAWTREWRVR